MENNELKIRLSGTANIRKPLELGKTYDMTVKEIECREAKEMPNDDGTKNTVYKLVINELSEVTIISEKECNVAKKLNSQSKKLRWIIEQRADDKGVEREYFYNERMNEIIKREEELLSDDKFNTMNL